MAAVRTPSFMWAQDDAHLFITINLSDASEVVVNFTDTKMVFSGTRGGQQYSLDFEFAKEVKASESKHAVTARKIEVVVVKTEEGYWSYLPKEKNRYKGILEVDWEKWRDEDDEDFDDSKLGGMSDLMGGGGGMPGMGGMGGMPGMGGMGGMPGMDGLGGMGGADFANSEAFQKMMAQAGEAGEGQADSDDEEVPNLEEEPAVPEPEEAAAPEPAVSEPEAAAAPEPAASEPEPASAPEPDQPAEESAAVPESESSPSSPTE